MIRSVKGPRSLYAALALLLLAGCSEVPDLGVHPYQWYALHFSIAADPTNLNPLFLHPDAASVEQQLARLSFEPFIDLDAKGKPVLALLDRMPAVSADGRTITYHLRPGVKWSDGVPVSAEDVRYTLKAILDPKNPVRSREGYELIDRVATPDAHTVIFHLSRAWAPAAMTYFSYGTSPQFVLPAHVLRKQEPLATAAFNAMPSVVDGPFKLASWRHGDGLFYLANHRYWRGASQIPKVSSLDVRIAPDPSTNLVMLQSGRLDWNLIAPVQFQLLQGKPGLKFVTTPTAVVAGLVFNTKHASLRDPKVRRALAMAIDRNAISSKITLRKYPVTDMLQPQFSWAYDPSIKQPGYDPKAAERVLRPLRLHLTYVQFPESMTGVRVATTVQAELRDVGVDVNIKSVANAQLFMPKAGVLAQGQFDIAYVPFTMGSDPDDSFVLGCHGASNYMQWCSAEVDADEGMALATTDQNARKKLYREIGQLVARDVPVLYLFNADYIYAYRSPRLTGFEPNAFLPTWNAWEWSVHE